MNAADLRDRLIDSAERMGWPVVEAPDFVRPHFRGRPDDAASTGPLDAFGLRLGDFPILVAPVTLSDEASMRAALRALHGQMVMARSYMRQDEVINAHILLCATDPSPTGDWRSIVDLAERDETVCRKIVWVPRLVDVEASYAEFIARTFLAIPWLDTDERHDAALDANQGLALRLLVKQGLSNEVAARWVEVVDTMRDDPDAMVTALASAVETVP